MGLASMATRSALYMRDVKAEVKKVTWPTWDDLRRTTVVICIVVICIGIVIGLIDKLFAMIFIDLLPRFFG